MKVQCIKPAGGLVLNSIYTVTESFIDRFGRLAYMLLEIDPPRGTGWKALRFKPLEDDLEPIEIIKIREVIE